ncbi:aldehyde dehydrogenase (NADP(+)) [Sphingobacterium bovistauri]|nr:aldehyde dehydrogenase (NADP(+)) [Sphingobacterium bovistauri]
MLQTNKMELDILIANAEDGYKHLQQMSRKDRAELMYSIASSIEALGDELIQTAHEETNLPLARLNGEKARTIHQWRLYADVTASGVLLDARIDYGEGKNDIRKYNVGLGPVVVFGASNFPFAFSTAGGDTASAIGAGCSVIYKEHSAHPRTSRIMAKAIYDGLKAFGAPNEIFGYASGNSHDVGQSLVANPKIKAVAFTGSFQGGMALFKIGANRPEPIPVFAEMGSLNPVIAMPEFLQSNTTNFAKEYIASLTMGCGQFCTNPGILFLLKNEVSENLKQLIKQEFGSVEVGHMLHEGIRKSYDKSLDLLNSTVVANVVGSTAESRDLPIAVVYSVNATDFLKFKHLQEEVFGPCGVIVECDSISQMEDIISNLAGQLTITFAATKQDIQQNLTLVDLVKNKCGRLLFNGMPTGVEVVYAMQHGGVFPSSTDSRFTSVGPDAMKRFLRPISFQNWPDTLLPLELQNSNPSRIERIENNKRILP